MTIAFKEGFKFGVQDVPPGKVALLLHRGKPMKHAFELHCKGDTTEVGEYEVDEQGEFFLRGGFPAKTWKVYDTKHLSLKLKPIKVKPVTID